MLRNPGPVAPRTGASKSTASRRWGLSKTNTRKRICCGPLWCWLRSEAEEVERSLCRRTCPGRSRHHLASDMPQTAWVSQGTLAVVFAYLGPRSG